MIKFIGTITKPFQEPDETEETFIKGLVGAMRGCVLKNGQMFIRQNSNYKSYQIKRDDIDRIYMVIHALVEKNELKKKYKPEIYALFSYKSEMEMARYIFDEGTWAQRSLALMKQAGYERKTSFFEIPEQFEKIYKESFTGDIVPCPNYLNGCNCNICTWVRGLEIPNFHEHDNPPRCLEEIGK